MSGIIWIVVVGFVAGIIARFLSPGPNKPTGFVLTVVLGIAGAFLATFIGQADRLVPPRSRRGIRHGDNRRRRRPLHLEPARGARSPFPIQAFEIRASSQL